RRSRTPSSVAYRPTPWRFRLAPVPLDLAELGRVEASAEATVFDFGAVSVGLHVPLSLLPNQMTHLAGSLSEATPIVQAARKAAAVLYEKLLPALEQPELSELTEEYFVFHLPPSASGPDLLKSPEKLLNERAAWTAGIVRLEDEPLSADEVREALRLRISY